MTSIGTKPLHWCDPQLVLAERCVVVASAAARAKPGLPGDNCFGRRAGRFPQE